MCLHILLYQVIFLFKGYRTPLCFWCRWGATCPSNIPWKFEEDPITHCWAMSLILPLLSSPKPLKLAVLKQVHHFPAKNEPGGWDDVRHQSTASHVDVDRRCIYQHDHLSRVKYKAIAQHWKLGIASDFQRVFLRRSTTYWYQNLLGVIYPLIENVAK